MIAVQITNKKLLDIGPIVETEIHSSDETFFTIKNYNGEKDFFKAKMLIDTGSNISGLDKKIIKKLKLNKYAQEASVNGVGGTNSYKMYRCILYLPIFQHKGLPIDVIEGDYAKSAYHGILGRDVLQYCSFVYDGWSNTFKLIAVDV